MLEYWVLWVLLGGFVVFFALRCLHDVAQIFTPPIIISLLVFGILVKSYFDFDEIAMAVLLDQQNYIMTLSYAVLCMTCFSVAYIWGERRRVAAPVSDRLVEALPSKILAAYCAFFGLIGFWAQYEVAQTAGGLAEFYSKNHGSGADYSNISGYLHGLPTFMWAALMIAFIRLQKIGMMRSQHLLVVFLAIGTLLAAHTFLFGNRNGIIRFTILLGGAYIYMRRPSFTQALPLMGILAVAVGTVLVIANIRHHLVLGSDVGILEALEEYFLNKAERGGKTDIRLEAGGHEFFFNIAVVGSAWEAQIYDYGAQFIHPIINFIPRSIWPDKPFEADFGVNYFHLVENYAGWSPGEGAAISAIGYTFLSFSWLGCLIWAVLGYYSGKAVRAARTEPTIMNLGLLLSLLVGCIYWGTQSWSAFFFAFLFTYGPVLGLRWLALWMIPVAARKAILRAPARGVAHPQPTI